MQFKENVFFPFIEKSDIDAVNECLEVGWLGQGSYTREFEEKVRQHIECHDRFVVAVSTCYAALHLALVLTGVKKGDEIITPSLNNVADFQAIEHTGASIVFCDILPDTLCIDLDKAEALITPRTKAIIVMDYACWQVDHEKAQALAKKYDIKIIHDAAHSFGWRYKSKMVGSFSDFTAFSFDPVKAVTCIDGGILIVQSEHEQKLAQELRILGMGQSVEVNYQNRRAWSYDVHRTGFRYHLVSVHAALGLAQLNKLESIAQKRRDLFGLYSEHLASIPQLTLPRTKLSDVIPLLYVIRVAAEARDELRKKLHDEGFETGLHWKPGHLYSYFADRTRGPLSVTDQVYSEFLSLPFHPKVNAESVQAIAAICREVLSHHPICSLEG
jgi:dTDP-4-amino-4,6-dideoxygalactose transaminase